MHLYITLGVFKHVFGDFEFQNQETCVQISIHWDSEGDSEGHSENAPKFGVFADF